MHLYCPRCSGTMQRYVGDFVVKYGLHGLAFKRAAEYIVCNDCPVVSEVDTRTGALIDLGAVGLNDLLHPVEEPVYFVIAATNRRTDS